VTGIRALGPRFEELEATLDRRQVLVWIARLVVVFSGFEVLLVLPFRLTFTARHASPDTEADDHNQGPDG